MVFWKTAELSCQLYIYISRQDYYKKLIDLVWNVGQPYEAYETLKADISPSPSIV